MNEQEVKDIITREVDNGCGYLGYRAIWHLLLLEYQLQVPRHLVAQIANEVDPYGVQLRKRRRFTRRRYLNYGPNCCWHAELEGMNRQHAWTVQTEEFEEGFDG